MKKKILLAALLALAVLLGGCGVAGPKDASPTKAASPSTSTPNYTPPPEPDPEPAPSTEEGPKVMSFGETVAWEDGVEANVGAPKPYSPSEYTDTKFHPLVFSITIKNGSTSPLDPSTLASLTSGGQEAEQIYDYTNLPEEPSTLILPGRTVRYKIAFDAKNAKDLTMEFAPSYDYKGQIWSTLSAGAS